MRGYKWLLLEVQSHAEMLSSQEANPTLSHLMCRAPRKCENFLSCIRFQDLFILFIFSLHLFILQALYIVLQDLKMKMLFVELNIRLQE